MCLREMWMQLVYPGTGYLDNTVRPIKENLSITVDKHVDPKNNRHLAIFHLGDSCYNLDTSIFRWNRINTHNYYTPLYKTCNAYTIIIHYNL